MNPQDTRALLEECLRLNGELRLPSVGTSMWPDLQSGDELRLKRIEFDAIAPGDIVLYSHEQVLLAHRVLKTYTESGRAWLLLKGDNRTFADPPILYEQVVGRVEEARRAGKLVYQRERRRRDRWTALASQWQDRFWQSALLRVLGDRPVPAEGFAVYQLIAQQHGWAPTDALPEQLDWELVYRLAREGRLTPLLSGATHATMPDTFAQQCQRDLRENQAHHLLLYQQIEAVLAAFEAAGIRLLVLKGPVNADGLYGRSAWRPMVDLDLLVHDDDWARSVALLAELGFQTEGSSWDGLTEQLTGQVALLKPLGPMVAAIELHRDLRILSERLAVRGEVNLARAWQEARPYACGQARALRLSPEDALAYASTHWAQHHFYSSIWLVDIALMAARGELNWDKLVRQAHADGVAHFVWAALFSVQLLFAAPVPPEVLTALQPPFPKATIIKHLVWKKTTQSFREEADGRSILLQLLLFASWRWTLAGLFSGLVPSAQWLRQHYEPDGKTPRHRLLWRHWGNLLRLVRG